jgi:hypothetical protein
LLPADTTTPDLGPAVPVWMDQYAAYQQAELHVFVAAMDNLFLVTAALSALAVLGALLLRSGPAPATPAGFAPPPQATPSAASGDGDPTRSAQALAAVRSDTPSRGA